MNKSSTILASKESELNASPTILALAGKPNSGKSVIFNLLTGGRQRVANYPGVTIESYQGSFTNQAGQLLQLHDLPGLYGLSHQSSEEVIARKVLTGQMGLTPNFILAIIEATHLEMGIKLVLELQQLGLPILVLLNKMDQAQRNGMQIDCPKLAQVLQTPVVPIVATHRHTRAILLQALADFPQQSQLLKEGAKPKLLESHEILAQVLVEPGHGSKISQRLDAWLLHPFWGMVSFFGLLFLLFQLVFVLASVPMDLFDTALSSLIELLRQTLAPNLLRELLCDGLLPGVGSVLIFLPQLILLFAGIVILEDSGYMARASFMLDNTMRRIGLNGKAFLPLLSSYACAIPAIMATRVMEKPRDRLLTILVTPITTCSARLPVYTLIIAAFIPRIKLMGFISFQAMVMFALYLVGALSLLVCSRFFHRHLLPGSNSPILMELPDYSLPQLSAVLRQICQRCLIFIYRAGTIIAPIVVLVWWLSSYPAPPSGSGEAAINHSYIAMIGHFISPIFRPIGFNWQIVTALIPSMAAREVAIAVLASIYAVGDAGSSLLNTLHQQWSLATALSLLSWYIYAPQCIATLVIIRRETNSYRWPLFVTFYLFFLAYVSSFLTYNITNWIVK